MRFISTGKRSSQRLPNQTPLPSHESGQLHEAQSADGRPSSQVAFPLQHCPTSVSEGAGVGAADVVGAGVGANVLGCVGAGDVVGAGVGAGVGEGIGTDDGTGVGTGIGAGVGADV